MEEREAVQRVMARVYKDRAARTIGNVNPGDYTPESVDKFRGSGNYADLVPVDKKAGAEAEKSNKEFRGLKGQLESLYGRKASIQKGYDPISGQVIPQTQIDDALRTVNEKIFDAENYMKNTYPEHWGRYKPTIAAPPQSAVDQLKTPPAGPAGAPQSPGKPLDQATASQILNEAGGDREKARQIAKQRGYTF